MSTFVSPFLREESLKRADELVGKPFEQLPGKPAQHKVLGTLSDGTVVRVKDVEMVYNDWLLFSYVDGEGTYEESYKNSADQEHAARQLEILDMAKRMFRGSAS